MTREDMQEQADQHVLQVNEAEELEPGPLAPPGEPSIPYNRTTPASNLLDWLGPEELLWGHLDAEVARHINRFPLR